jgi:hypothetical protein
LGSKSAIEAHAQKLLGQIAEQANNTETHADVTAATANAVVPSFSKGTLSLDPNERRTEGQPSSLETAVDAAASGGAAIPVETEDAEAGAQAQAAAAGQRERDETGRFRPAEPAAAAPAAAPKPAKKPATPTKAAAAAAEAAEEVEDEWAEIEELIFEHDDGSKYPVRARKKDAKQVARFNQRQAQVSRAINAYGKYKDVLAPLIQSGRLDGILPHIQRALQDPEFAEYVNQGYNRRLIGQPLNAPAQPPAHVIDQPTPGQVAPMAMPTAESLGISDPFVAEAVAPLVQQYQQVFSRLNAMEQAQQRAAQQAQQQAAYRAQQEAQLKQAHQDLSQQFPSVFHFDQGRNDPEWQRVWRFANDGGYFQGTNDLRLAAKLAARDYMDSRADTYSPAAELLAKAERANLRGAQAQAAAARSVGGGAASAPHQQPKTQPKPPSSTDANGKRLSPREYMAKQLAYQTELANAG